MGALTVWQYVWPATWGTYVQHMISTYDIYHIILYSIPYGMIPVPGTIHCYVSYTIVKFISYGTRYDIVLIIYDI